MVFVHIFSMSGYGSPEISKCLVVFLGRVLSLSLSLAFASSPVLIKINSVVGKFQVKEFRGWL